MDNIEIEANHILRQIMKNEEYAKYVDASYPIPTPFIGSGPIKLIVLGQDPTVKNSLGRKSIKTVLNLDRNRSVRAYLAGVCNDLGIRITENVYATNLYKNFFINPPTQIYEINIFQTFLHFWLPLLLQEISQFADVPILTLGKPILAPIIRENTSNNVREYWSYTPCWREGKLNPFKFIESENNVLNRIIFPFPHQPSLRKPFYKVHLRDYALFMKSIVFD